MSHLVLIVVVVYEVELNESQTLETLIKLKKDDENFPDVLVYDNSFKSRYNQNFSNDITYYRHNPCNSGVGGAYNYAVELGTNLRKEWLILFDQDTNVNPGYLAAFYTALQKYPNETLFCPTVRGNNKIISPTYYFANRCFLFNKSKVGVYRSRYHTLINSSLAISLKEMKDLGGYDADLPLDYSDHYFFHNYKKRNKKFVIINCDNYHNLSSFSDDGFESIYNRLKGG